LNSTRSDSPLATIALSSLRFMPKPFVLPTTDPTNTAVEINTLLDNLEEKTQGHACVALFCLAVVGWPEYVIPRVRREGRQVGTVANQLLRRLSRRRLFLRMASPVTKCSPPENTANGHELIFLINNHSESVKRGTIVCAATTCCHCGTDLSGSPRGFAFHGTRNRRFLVIVGDYVYRVAALLARWRCPHCRRTFTDYPSFACPHKAYTLPQMADRAARYVGDAMTSYRTAVRFARLPICYHEAPAGRRTHRCGDQIVSLAAVAHTSLFRWVTCLANKIFRQADALATDFAPAVHKYTSGKRRSILVACRETCASLQSTPRLEAVPG
jgi:hypothetical protein